MVFIASVQGNWQSAGGVSSPRNAPLGAAVWLMAAAIVGCSAIDLDNTAPWLTANSAASLPSRMEITWVHDVERQPGKPVLRGFRGRLQFYARDASRPGARKDSEPEKPIKVNGTLTVYAFEETPDGKLNASPSRRFAFNSDQVKKQYLLSPSGPAYNVWLPWDKVGGPSLHVSLLTRFEVPKGPVVISDRSRQFLPGADRAGTDARADAPGGDARRAAADAER